MAQSLEAELSLQEVRLGTEGYSVKLRVTKPQPEAIDPEIDAFISGLNVLKKVHIRESIAKMKEQVEKVDHEDVHEGGSDFSVQATVASFTAES